MQELTKTIIKSIKDKKADNWTTENGSSFLAEEILSLSSGIYVGDIILKIKDEPKPVIYNQDLWDFNLNETEELLKYQLIKEIENLINPIHEINKNLSGITEAKIDIVSVLEGGQAHSIINNFTTKDKANMGLFR